ncbi:MAG: transcription termination factor NusA [Micrococcaceae bacterium]
MDIDLNALEELANEREIPLESITPAIEKAILTAYYKTRESSHEARCELDVDAGKVNIWVPEYDENDEIIGEFDDTPEGFGRVAASTARQVILNSLRDVEDGQMVGSFQAKKGEIVSGIIQQSHNPDMVHVDLGDVEAVLPLSEQVPGEQYTHGKRIRALVIDASMGNKGPAVTISRSHPDLVRKLFALEVPEIVHGTVKVMALAREAGHRTKMAVKATEKGLNPKGACIGEMGARVRAVMNELNGEKIDIVDYSNDPADFISHALSPSQVLSVEILDEESRSARAIVPDYQLSLAIGKEGQNARLAAKLTGWRIDIISDMEAMTR